jgi:hypothetical protein
VLALFWLDLREALKSRTPIAYTPWNHRGKCAVVFVLFALPEMILQGMEAISFSGPGLKFITPLLFLSNVIVAVFFVVQVKKTMVQIGTATKATSKLTKTNEQTTADTGDTGSSNTRQAIMRNQKLMRHMAWWMAVFSWFVLLQTVGIMMLPFIRNSYAGLFMFVLFASTSRIGMSAAKVWSLKPPRDKVEKSSALLKVHDQRTPGVLPSSIGSSIPDRSQWD